MRDGVAKAKIIAAVVAVVVVLILILQNTEQVTTRILFISVEMPRAVLLVVMLAIGFGIGLLSAGRLYRRGDKKKLQ